MLRSSASLLLVITLAASLSARVMAGHVTGQVTHVDKDAITATFPVPVKQGSLMTVLAGEGQAVAGLAISRDCAGTEPPYLVSATLYLTMDAAHLAAGKKVYVNSVNTLPAPSSFPAHAAQAPSKPRAVLRDLRLYYYAAGQKVGYGALGLGYERSIRFSRGIGIELDAGITGVGSIDSARADVINTEQLIKNAVGRLRFDFSGSLGLYSAYRWNEARGDAEHWQKVAAEVGQKQFEATSELESGTIQARGIEYGITLRPAKWLGLCAGFVPAYRSDYGSLGVRSEPAYTAELRIGFRRGGLRLRALYSDGYWAADMGAAIR